MTRRAVLVLAAAALVLAWAGIFFVPLPRILALRFRSPGSTAFIEARKERLREQGKSAEIDRKPVPLSDVSSNLVSAAIAAEDARFFEHGGIDWEAVRKAREWNRKQEGKPRPRLHGASTITQQLAKNLYLSPDRSYWRKAREAAIAVALEVLLSKQRILEHYLSSIEWGERVFGCEAAARKYFGTSADRLSPREAAWLAAMIPSPALYLANPARHQRRAARIARFARAGKVPPELLEED